MLDNMLLGAPVQPGEGMFRALFPGMWKRQEKENVEKAEALLERFLLIKKKNDYAGALSGGQRKLLEMARALMSDPQLVMLDEPMAGSRCSTTSWHCVRKARRCCSWNMTSTWCVISPIGSP